MELFLSQLASTGISPPFNLPLFIETLSIRAFAMYIPYLRSDVIIIVTHIPFNVLPRLCEITHTFSKLLCMFFVHTPSHLPGPPISHAGSPHFPRPHPRIQNDPHSVGSMPSLPVWSSIIHMFIVYPGL